MKKLIAAGASAALLAFAAAPAMGAFNNSGIWVQANTTVTKTSLVSSSQTNLTSQRSASLGGLVALSGNFNTSTQASAIIVAQ